MDSVIFRFPVAGSVAANLCWPPMTLSEQVEHDLKEAMKAREADRLSVLRMLKSAIKYAAIEKGGQTQRQDSIATFEQGNRPELAAKEQAEITLLQKYLPQALGPEELGRLVEEAIAEVGATGRAQMGAVMKALGPKVAGRADGKTLSQEVQRRLA